MDDYGNDMLDIAQGFTVEQDNAVCRWITDGMPGEWTEDFLRSIGALEAFDSESAAIEASCRDFFDNYTPLVIEDDLDRPYEEYVVGGVVLTRAEYRALQQ